MISEVKLAAENLWNQKTRTVLTALGIIFGVGAVIGMLAIGAGAREESLQFIEQLGVRNLLIDSHSATSEQELQQRRRASPGLTERDVRILSANVDSIELISARKSLHPTQMFPRPAQALFESDGKMFVYLRSGGAFARKDVTLVRRNETRVVLTGLHEGDVVALANPTEAAAKKTKAGANPMEAIK